MSEDEYGLYTVAEGSRLASLPRQTVDGWLRSDIGVQTVSASAVSPPLLTFEDLITLFVVRELRRASVDIADIRGAERQLAERWHVRKPFAYGEFRTGYGAIVTVLKKGERPVAVAGAVQEILYDLVKRDLRNVTYDARKRASLWRPSPHIALRPDIQFGQPCIEGTRVTTRTVSQYLAAGETVEALAEEFGITTAKLEAALAFEESLAKRRH